MGPKVTVYAIEFTREYLREGKVYAVRQSPLRVARCLLLLRLLTHPINAAASVPLGVEVRLQNRTFKKLSFCSSHAWRKETLGMFLIARREGSCLRISFVFFLFSWMVVAQPLQAQTRRPELKRCRVDIARAGERVLARILSVEDGDTVSAEFLALGESFRIRLIGFDTPETKLRAQGELRSQGPGGEESAAAMRAKVPVGTVVALKIGGSVCDVYGARVVASLFSLPPRVPGARSNNGGRALEINPNAYTRDIGLEMVREGWAINFCYAPALDNCLTYRAAAMEAHREGRSVFLRHAIPYPQEFRLQWSPEAVESAFVGSMVSGEFREFRSLADAQAFPIFDRIYFSNRAEAEEYARSRERR